MSVALAGVTFEQLRIGMVERVELVGRRLHHFEEGRLEALHIGRAADGDAGVVRPDGPDAADAPDASSGTACGVVTDMLADGQNILGQLAMHGPELVYVNRVGGVTELGRVPRRGGAPPIGMPIADLAAVIEGRMTYDEVIAASLARAIGRDAAADIQAAQVTPVGAKTAAGRER